MSYRISNYTSCYFFYEYKLISISGKQIEEKENARIRYLMYKILSSSKNSGGLSIGFHGDNTAREKKLTTIKTTKGKYHIKIF